MAETALDEDAEEFAEDDGLDDGDSIEVPSEGPSPGGGDAVEDGDDSSDDDPALDAKRLSALVFAGTLRGARTTEDALYWAASRGLIEWYDDLDEWVLTATGRVRADELIEVLPKGEQRRSWKPLRSAAIVAGVVWLARRLAR